MISAHNEENHIGARLDNVDRLDYPGDRLQVIIVSDASTDGTDTIVKGFPRVSLLRMEERAGKVEGINRSVPGVRGDIVVLSDANTMFRSDALRRLVAPFAKPSIGCVSGELHLGGGEGASAYRESLYWRLESGFRRLSSRAGWPTGAVGPIYAFRRNLFRPVPDTMFCDVVLPVRIALAGYRVVTEPAAIAEEQVDSTIGAEFHRRWRNAARGIRSIRLLLWEAAEARQWGHLFALLSHKVLRWFTLTFLAGLLVGSAGSDDSLVRALFFVQSVFYLSAFAGGILEMLGIKGHFLRLPFYVVGSLAVTQVGALAGLITRGRPWWNPRGA